MMFVYIIHKYMGLSLNLYIFDSLNYTLFLSLSVSPVHKVVNHVAKVSGALYVSMLVSAYSSLTVTAVFPSCIAVNPSTLD